jgi:hypothetical protein
MMKLSLATLGMAVALGVSGTALAAEPAAKGAEKPPVCAPKMICASHPETVVAGLKAAGLPAELVMDKDYPMLVNSTMHEYKVSFEGENCTEKVNCKELVFAANFNAEPIFTLELFNDWNRRFRFGTMSMNDKGQLSLTYYFTTVGGMNQEQFNELTKILSVALEDMEAFLDEARTKAEAKK